MALVADLSAELDFRVVTQPPAITRALGDFKKPDALEDHRLFVEQRAQIAVGWISKGPEARDLVWGKVAYRQLDEENSKELDDWIERLDSHLEFQTGDFLNTQRFVERELRLMRRKLSAKEFADAKRVFDRGAQVWKSEIDETYDFVTFLRAVRATTVKPHTDAPTFDDPNALSRYLTSVIGNAE